MRNRIVIIAALILVAASLSSVFVSAADCFGAEVKLYDPLDDFVTGVECDYSTPDQFSCSINYRKCLITGIYTIFLHDDEVGCSGLNNYYPFFFCDATPPNIKGTSPIYFNVNENNVTDNLLSWWKVYEHDMVAYYSFDKDNSTYARDWTPYNHPAKKTNSPTYHDGYYGNGRALYFETNQYLTIERNLSNPKKGMTIGFWINSSNNNRGIQMLFDAAVYGNFNITLDDAHGSCIDTKGAICIDGKAEINSTYMNESKMWWHVAIVQNITKTWMYLNGVNVANGTGQTPTIDKNMRIAQSSGGNRQFNGSLDEIRIFNRTLNKNELIDLYLSGLTTHSVYYSAASTSDYRSTKGISDSFSSAALTNYSITGDTNSATWALASGRLKCTANEGESVDAYNYIENTKFNAAGKDILMEYDLIYNDDAKTGGLLYRGVRAPINPNLTGWHDLDNSTKYNGTINQSGQMMHIKMYIYGNRTGKPVSALYVNKEYRFYDEIVNKTSFSSNYVGFYNERHKDSFEIDNLKVSVLNKNISVLVEEPTDNSPPNPPGNYPSVTPEVAMGTLRIDWASILPKDTGRTYYAYVRAYDYQENPSNMVEDGDFERGDTSYKWTGYGGAGVTLNSNMLYVHYGNYSAKVVAGIGGGISQSVANYADYKGYNVYWSCWARAETGTLAVTMGGDGLSSTTPYTLTTTYQSITHTDTVSPTAAELEPYIKTTSATGTFYVDNCVLQAIQSGTITVGIDKYYCDETSGNSGGDDQDWTTLTTYDDSGLKCFSPYTYKMRARDKNLEVGDWSATSPAVYPITATCTYGSGALGYCLDNPTETCYYSNKLPNNCVGEQCLLPGTVSTPQCFYEPTASRADDCDSDGCNVLIDTEDECTAGEWSVTHADCAIGTNCFWNSTNPCSARSGWHYQTASTFCSAGVSTCCPSQGNWATGSGCTSTGATGTSYDRDTSEARCEATDAGCSVYKWVNMSTSACCGDDGVADTFCTSGFQGGSCYQGTWYSNHCSNGILDSACGETAVDYGGPWCNERPTVVNIILNSTSGLNRTTDNLTVYFNASDYDYDEMFTVVDWRVQKKSIARLNMPFQTDNTSAGKFKDFSSYENNGTGYSGVGWTRFGAVGGAAVFDGSNDYITVANSNSLDVTKEVTYAAWIKTKRASTGGLFRGIVDRSDGTKSCGLDQTNGVFRFFCYTDGTGSPGVAQISETAYLDNKWHFIVGEYNRTNSSIYVDGIFKSGVKLTGNIVDSNANLAIGTRTDSLTSVFNGSIDEVRVFNRSLSSQQILQMYNDEYNQQYKLVLNMHFGRNVTSIASKAVMDYSLSDNNGTLGDGVASAAPIWKKTGKVGGSYQFDGKNDNMTVDNFYHQYTKGGTIGIWFYKKGDSAGTNSAGGLIRNGGASRPLLYVKNTEQLQVLWSGATGMPVGTGQYTNMYTIKDNTWFYTAFVWNSTHYWLYINDTLKEQNNFVPSSITSGTSVIGIYSTNNVFNGSIDEVKVFNATLSARDIKKIYGAGLQKYTATVHSNETVKGFNWSTMLWASDNYLLSTNYSTRQLEIRNTPPNFTAPYVNTTALLNKSKISCLGGTFSDIDGDSESSREFKWYKNSGVIGGATSQTLNLATTTASPGDYLKCSARVNDGEDYSLWKNSSNRARIASNITDCTLMNKDAWAYFLTEDISNHAGSNCMVATSKNVTLNCQGYLIDGTGGYTGITTSNITTTIKNCELTEWSRGIVLSSNNSLVKNSNASSCTRYGLWLNHSSFANITKSYYTNNVEYDVFATAASDKQCDNRLTRVNGTGSKPIRYFNSTVALNNWNNNATEIILCDADSSTISSTKLLRLYSNGIILVRSDDCTLNDVNVSRGYNGVYMADSIGSTISNSHLENSTRFDFFINASSPGYCDNTLTNVNGTDEKPIRLFNRTSTIQNWHNNATEIILCDADSSTISSVAIDHANRQNNAFLMIRTDNAVITELNLTDMYAGLYLISSSSNRIKGSWFRSNNFSAYFENSGSNNLTYSKLSDSQKYEVLISASAQNIIYNNLLNSSHYFRFNGTVSANNWNTTVTSGTRIFSSGSNIGGNYWTNSSGNGHSDTCLDLIGNGFCDSEVNVTDDGLNTDWLPLTSYTSFEGNMFIVQDSLGVNCTLVDVDGDVGARGSISQSCSSAPGASDFTVRTSDGTVQMWVDHSSCDVCLRGLIKQKQGALSIGSGEFLVKNNSGVYIFKINASGNLYARGSVTGNRDI